jgi:hypothetical protein
MEKYFHNINLLKNISTIHKSQDEVKKRYPTVFDLLKTGIKISIVYNPIDENDKKYTYGIYFRHNNTIELYLHDLLSSFHPSTDPIRKFLDKLTNDNITRTLIHEMTHAYDQQRSKTKALDIHQNSVYMKAKNELKNDPAYKEIMHELYLKLPHEYWARFVEFLYAVDNKINTYDFKQIAPMLMNNPHLNFKILDKDDKKRILARLANIYAKKNQSKTWDLFLYYKDNDFLLDEDLNTPQEIYSFFKSLLNNFKSLSPQQVKQIRQYSIDISKTLK